MAHRLAQAPNTYPTWFAPKARVMLGFSPKLFSQFPAQYVEVGPPKAKLCYRVVEPADYNLRVSSTNWIKGGRRQTEFSFHATIPGPTNQWTLAPRGTVVLLHGYGLAQFAMAPWALRLGQEGWRCVLVDLRGHGKSTGKKVYFGIRETADLSQLLDQLAKDGQLAGPVSVMGESYGAALALRWKIVEPRVQSVVAIAPYAVLSNAVLNIARDYAGWMPEMIIRAGVKKLPSVLKVQPAELDTTTVMRESPVSALFVAGTEDRIMPLADVDGLRKLAGPGSEMVVVPEATHETVTYYFKKLAPPVVAWLEKTCTGAGASAVLPCAAQVGLTK
jgi:pimeloyl-ACP methyl ester carboxylesterase